MNNLLNRTLRNSQLDINTCGDTAQIVTKLRDVKEAFPLMKEVDCPYQAARWPMECQASKKSDQLKNTVAESFTN